MAAADTYLRLNAAKTPIATVEDNGSSPALDAADLRALLDGKTDTGVALEIGDSCKVKVTFDELVRTDGEKGEINAPRSIDAALKESDDGGLTFSTLANDSTVLGERNSDETWTQAYEHDGMATCIMAELPPGRVTSLSSSIKRSSTGLGRNISIAKRVGDNYEIVWALNDCPAADGPYTIGSLALDIPAAGGVVLALCGRASGGTPWYQSMVRDGSSASANLYYLYHANFSWDQFTVGHTVAVSSFAREAPPESVTPYLGVEMLLGDPVTADNIAECNQAKLEVVASAAQTVAALGLYLPINEEDGCTWEIAEVPIATVDIPAAVIGAGAGAEVEVSIVNPSAHDALAGSMLLICPDTAPLKAWGALADAVAAQHSARLRYGASQTFICKKWNWLTGVCSASAPEANTADCGCGCSGYECEPIVLESDWLAGTTITIALSQVARVGCGMLPRRFGVIALLKNRIKT